MGHHLPHSLMSQYLAFFTHYVMYLTCLGLKVLATMHTNDYRDSVTQEDSRTQRPKAIDSAFKEFSLIKGSL